MKSCLTILVLTLFFRSAAAQQDALMVVHEWGTFTSLQDEFGDAIGGLNTDDEPVPEFVHSPNDLLAMPTELPRTFFAFSFRNSFDGKGLPGLHADVTMRLETPVMYFYPPTGIDVPVEMDVSASFRGGWLSQYYPEAEMEAPGMVVTLPNGSVGVGGIDESTLGSLTWKRLQIGVEEEGPDTDEEVWLAPRRVSAASVSTLSGEAEKYLFYRGIGHLDGLLRVSRSEDGEWLEIRQQPFPDSELFSGDTIGSAWLAHIREDGSSAFLHVGSLDIGGESAQMLARIPSQFPDSEFSTENLELLRAQMHQTLVDEGLFVDEADAMLDTWKEAYFHSPGLRLFFTVPQAWTDYYLPLEFSAPVELTRIMVGRIEIVTAEQRDLLADIATRPGEPFPTDAFGAFLGEDGPIDWQRRPYTHVRLREIAKELDLELPQNFVDFLDLGRMRNALILDELERRPTQSLRDFVDAYKLHAYAVPEIRKTSNTIIHGPDEPILDDALARDWRVECKNGAQVLGLTQHELYSGQLSTLVKARPEDAARLWSMTLTPRRQVSQAGLAGVRFVLRPGDVELAGPSELHVVVNDMSINLAQTDEPYRLNLAQPSWQVLEIPFSAFAESSPTDVVSRIGLEGNLHWTFYLDDVRLVRMTEIPSGLPEPDMTAVLEDPS